MCVCACWGGGGDCWRSRRLSGPRSDRLRQGAPIVIIIIIIIIIVVVVVVVIVVVVIIILIITIIFSIFIIIIVIIIITIIITITVIVVVVVIIIIIIIITAAAAAAAAVTGRRPPAAGPHGGARVAGAGHGPGPARARPLLRLRRPALTAPPPGGEPRLLSLRIAITFLCEGASYRLQAPRSQRNSEPPRRRKG